MKTLLTFAISILAIASATTLSAEGVKKMTIQEMRQKAEEFKKLPPEEQARIRAERKARREARTGGRIRNTTEQQGAVLILNAQKTVSTTAVSESMQKLASFLKIDIKLDSSDGVDVASTAALLKEKKANAVIYLAENKDYPTLLVAPDERWAFVNTAKLGDANLEDRAKKETIRAFTFLCGGVASQYPDPLTRPVDDIRRLDLIDEPQIPVDVLNRMPAYLKVMGVTPYRETTYRRACEEGWAPAPTNDIQKAVWDDVHKIPQQPMKIEFDPKKGR